MKISSILEDPLLPEMTHRILRLHHRSYQRTITLIRVTGKTRCRCGIHGTSTKASAFLLRSITFVHLNIMIRIYTSRHRLKGYLNATADPHVPYTEPFFSFPFPLIFLLPASIKLISWSLRASYPIPGISPSPKPRMKHDDNRHKLGASHLWTIKNPPHSNLGPPLSTFRAKLVRIPCDQG